MPNASYPHRTLPSPYPTLQEHPQAPPCHPPTAPTPAPFRAHRSNGHLTANTNRVDKVGAAATVAVAAAVAGGAHSEPQLRKRAEAWFASLALGERSRLLTFEDPAWCLLAANMAARLDRRAFAGQEVRFEVQPPPASGGCGGGSARYGCSGSDVSGCERGVV